MNIFSRLYHIFKTPKCRLKLKEEERECIAFANMLKQYTVEGKMRAVWFHIPNEFSGEKKKLFGCKLKMMGKIKGAPDYGLISDVMGAFLEFKSSKGRLTPEQRIFKAWCEHHGVAYEVVRTHGEGLEKLKEWTMLIL